MLFARFFLIWPAATAAAGAADDDQYLRLFAADLSLFSTVCYYLLLFAAV